MKRLTYLMLVGMVLLSMGSGNAFAQATASASVQGTITDQSGAAIKSAKLAITSTEQGWTRTADTSDTGFYTFELPAGIYTVKVNASGFSTSEAKDVDGVNPRRQLERVKTRVTGVRGASPALFRARNRQLRTFDGSARLIRDGALHGGTRGCLGESVSAAHAEKNHSH